jgi:hypothetical protein
LAGEPGTAALAEEIGDRSPPEQAAGQGRVDLVLGAGALANQGSAAGERRRSAWIVASGTQTDSSMPA